MGELVKIKSDNPAHPKGYYVQFKDRVKPGDVEYIEGEQNQVKNQAEESTKPITNKKKVKK